MRFGLTYSCKNNERSWLSLSALMNYFNFLSLDSNLKAKGKFLSMSSIALAPTPNLKVLRDLSNSLLMKN